MYDQKKPEIILESNTPIVENYDLENKSKIGKLFDLLKEINCEVQLVGPSQYELQFDPKDAFMVTIKGNVHKPGSAMYGSCLGRGETSTKALAAFLQELFSKTEQGHLVCASSASGRPLYRIILEQGDVRLEKYEPVAAT